MLHQSKAGDAIVPSCVSEIIERGQSADLELFAEILTILAWHNLEITEGVDVEAKYCCRGEVSFVSGG
jgi:hypothetical protein